MMPDELEITPVLTGKTYTWCEAYAGLEMWEEFMRLREVPDSEEDAPEVCPPVVSAVRRGFLMHGAAEMRDQALSLGASFGRILEDLRRVGYEAGAALFDGWCEDWDITPKFLEEYVNRQRDFRFCFADPVDERLVFDVLIKLAGDWVNGDDGPFKEHEWQSETSTSLD